MTDIVNMIYNLLFWLYFVTKCGLFVMPSMHSSPSFTFNSMALKAKKKNTHRNSGKNNKHQYKKKHSFYYPCL